MKFILKIFFLAILMPLLSLHSQVKAQEDAISKPKWEVGLNALWLDNKDKLLNNSLLFRYHHFKGDKSHAFRLRVGTYFRWGMKAWDLERHNFLIRLGYEWSKTMISSKRNLQLIYGFDLSFEKNKIESYLINATNLSQITVLQLQSDTREIGLVGIIGAKYFFLSSLSISIESNIMISNWKTNINNFNGGFIAIDSIPLNNSGGVIFARQSSDSTSNIYLIPISVVNISYHF